MKPVIFTICSANYFPKCLVLLDSLIKYAPECDHYLVLADTREASQNIINYKKWPFKIISMYDINMPYPEHFAFQYNVTELNTAIKPFVFTHLFNLGYKTAVYFDPDIEVYSSLDPMLNLLKTHNALLTPHVTEPIKPGAHHPTNWEVIWAGQYNFGYVALNSTPDVLKFVKFWEEALTSYCVADLGRYFYDQLPGSYIPSLVEKTHIIHSHSYNMAYWNIDQRDLTMQDGQYHTKHGPLVFFHYSGLNEYMPLMLTTHSKRVMMVKDSPAHKLVLSYIEKTSTYKKQLSDYVTPYPFNVYKDGNPINKHDRYRYLGLSLEQKLQMGDPFAAKEQITGIKTFPPRYFSYYELLSIAEQSGITVTLKKLLMDKIYYYYSFFPIKSLTRRALRRIWREMKSLTHKPT